MNIRVEGGHKLAVFLFDIPEICAWTNTQDLAGLLIVHGILISISFVLPVHRVFLFFAQNVFCMSGIYWMTNCIKVCARGDNMVFFL